MLSAYISKFASEARRRLRQQKLRRLIASIARTPLDPDLHEELASCLAWTNRSYASHAALRSAQFLRHQDRRLAQPVLQHRAPPDTLRSMDHNQYYWFVSLANKVIELSGAEPVSLLDVGGGVGQLAQFLPDKSYFLVEPSVNGLSADSLPFDEGTFDYVVCCHVLEHITPQARHQFLDRLMLSARRGVILLNPFFNARAPEKERLQLFIDTMNASWAREHLDCTLPKLDHVIEYAKSKGHKMTWEPNGFLPLSAAMVFANYYCRKSIKVSDFAKINYYFNSQLVGPLNSEDSPNALLITLQKAA